MWREEGLSHLNLFDTKDIFVLDSQKMHIAGHLASKEQCFAVIFAGQDNSLRKGGRNAEGRPTCSRVWKNFLCSEDWNLKSCLC